MKCRAWLLALAVLCGSGSEVKALCWEDAHCRGPGENVLECINLCESDLAPESPAYPEEDVHPRALARLEIAAAPSSAPGGPGAQRDDKRSYSMEHFRWGKPVGRKRRPIKVYANGVEEESSEAPPPPEARRERKGAAEGTERLRWGGPPAGKRYGGFMKSWDERGQRPLLTLFRNIISKDARQKRDQ